MNFEELKADYENKMAAKDDWFNGGYRTDVNSGQSYRDTLGFIGDVEQLQEDDGFIIKTAKSFANGITWGVSGTIGSLKMLRDKNIQQHLEQQPDYVINQEAVDILNNAYDTTSSWRYDVKKDSTAEQLFYGYAEGVGQMLTQIATRALFGAPANLVLMSLQISGAQYEDLRKAGVEPEKAFDAALSDGIIQGLLEEAGIYKVLKAFPAYSGVTKTLREIAVRGMSEGFTEFVQALPEQLSNIWAKQDNTGLGAYDTALNVAREWDKNASDNIKDMVFQGIIGMLVGSTVSGANFAMANGFNKLVVNQQNKHIENLVDKAKEKGMNSQYTQAVVDRMDRGETAVNIDAQQVLSYAQSQQVDVEKVATSLGVTASEIEDAAEAGLDITVSKGHMVQAMMEQNGFSEAIIPHVSYGEQGRSLNYYQMQKEMDKAYGEGSEVVKALDEELNAIEQSMVDAGVPKDQAKQARELYNAFAVSMSPENPAEWLQKNKLRFEDGGKGTAGRKQRGWTQKVWRKSGNSERYKGTVQDYKQAQLEVINQNNKMQDDYHTGIRSVNDILTAKEALDLTQEQLDNYEKEGYSYPDFTLKDGKAAIDSGYITVYSSKEIKPGVFVTPSKMMAADYAGDGTVYSKRIPVKDMAFINADEGNYAPVKQYLQKADAEIKGQFRQADDGTYIIDLFKGADASTVIHETGHYFFEIFMQESGLDTASDKLKKDRAAFLNYVGMTEEQWQAADFEGRRAAHERVATAFEQYLLEGKAPSKGLRGVFSRFSKWLKAIYSEVVKSDDYAGLTDDVRQVFDHWLAADADIEEAARMQGFYTKLDPKITSILGEKNKKWLEDKIYEAHNTAMEMLTRQYMRNFAPKRRAEIEAYRKEIAPQIEELVDSIKVNAAREGIRVYFTKDVSKTKEVYAEVPADGKKRKVTVFKKVRLKTGEVVVVTADPATIASKYLHTIGTNLENPIDRMEQLQKEIDARLQPIIDQIEASIDEYNNYVNYYEDLFSGEYNVDVGGLKEEVINPDTGKPLKPGESNDHYVYHNADMDLKDNFYAKYVAENGRKRLTKAEIRELAIEIYSGNDKYSLQSDAGDTSTWSEEDLAEVQADVDARAKEIKDMIETLQAYKENKEYTRMAKVRALRDEERLTFEMIAEQCGYSSGSEMAQDLLTRPTRQQMIKQLTDLQVSNKFPDYAKERAEAELAIIEALNNDKQGEVIALEQQLIDEAAQTASVTERTEQARMAFAREQKAKAEVIARNTLLNMPMREALNIRRFAMAERRAAASAKKAIKAGDFEAASEFKRQQMIAHAMVRHSAKLKQEVERTKKFVKRLRKLKKDKEHFGNEQNFNQIAHLLYRLGIVRKDYNPNNRTQNLAEYLAEMTDKLGDGVPDIDESITNEINDLRDSQNMTIEQYEKIRDALQNLYAIVKQDIQGTLDAKAKDFEETKTNITDNLNKLENKYTPSIGGVDNESFWARQIAQRQSLDNFLEMMDGWTFGYFSKTFGAPLKHAADLQAKLTMEYEDAVSAAMQKWLPNAEARRAADTEQYYEELGGNANKHTLVNMLIHLGNQSSMERLCTSRVEGAENSKLWVFPDANNNLTREEAIAMTRENLINFLGKNLTAADVEFAQAKVDAANKLWPLLAQVNIDTKGFAPAKVEATPIAFKPSDGDYMTFRGGYYPLARDSRLGSQRQGAEAFTGTEDGSAPIRTMSTVQNTSKGRTNASYPVKLNYGYEMGIIQDTIHDIAYRQVMMNFNKIFSDKDIASLMKRKLGLENYNILKETLWKCARPRSGQDIVMAERDFLNIADWIRRKTVNAIIACNIKISLQNLGNVFLFGNTVEGFTHADVLVAMRNIFTNPKQFAVLNSQVMEKSPFMRERAKAPDFALRQVMEENAFIKTSKIANGKVKAGANKVKDSVEWLEGKSLEWGAKLLTTTDNLTAVPVWWQAYTKKIQAGASEQEAVDFADTVIRRTLGSTRIQDVASVQRGSGFYKLVSAFQGFFNTQFNQWYREYKVDIKLFSEKEYKEAFTRVVQFALSKWLIACLANTIIGSLSFVKPFEEDEKKKWRDISQELIKYPLSIVGGPTGQAAMAFLQPMLGMQSYGYRLSIIENTLTKGVSLGTKINAVAQGKKDVDELAEPVAEITAIMLGLPLQFVRTPANLLNIAFDDMSFELEDIMNRRKKSERNRN